jgi:Ca2+-binding RTX toxin-like protein
MSFRKIVGAVAVSGGVLAGSLVAVPPTVGAAASPFEDEIGDQLALASASLAQASLLADLLPVIPGLEANPAMLLGVHELFVGGSGFAGLASLAASTNLAVDLPNLSGSGYTLDNYSHETSGSTNTVSFDVAIDRMVSVPITIIEDSVQIQGTDVDVSVTMPATTITMEFDSSDPVATFAFVDLPTFEFTASLSGNQEIPIQFGFADATASGDFNLHLTVALQLTDPDGVDRITMDEFSTLAIEDLIQLDFPTTPPNDIDIDLSLSADVFGTPFGGELTITDENFFSGAAPDVEFSATGANPIDLLTNISADTAITSLAQLVSSYGAAMLAGDVKLPFLSDGVFIPGDLGTADLSDFDRVFDVIQPLMDYVTPRSSGQIVCGTEVGPDPDGPGGVEGIPTGSLIALDEGQAVFCRAYTSVDGSALWSVNEDDVGGASTTTIGVDPTANIELSAGDDGAFAVEIEFTPDDGSGAITILPRPDTIQALLTELAAAGLVPTVDGAPDFDYDGLTEAFTFPFRFEVDGPITRDATINAGNSLVAATGITGLAAGATASADYTLSDISAGVTLGLIVTDDVETINVDDNLTNPPGPLDRFFLTDLDSLIEVGNVEVGGDLDMVGRLGFLEIAANVSGSLTTPTDVPGTDPDPALTVGLTPGTIPVQGGSIADAILVRDLLGPDLVDLVNAEVNLQFDGEAEVSANAAGLGASGGFDISWNLDDPTPTIDNFDAGFQNTLLPFGGDLTLVHDGAPAADPTLFTGTAAVNLLAEPGLVGSQLVDSAGNVCNITAVLSATQLTCDNPDGAVLNPITFADGESYDVKGNTLSKLADILAALDALVLYLEDAIGADAFDTQIDLIGVSPADIVGQIGELRRMIDEFRGVQDAYIQCIVQGAPDADIRAIPLDTSVATPPDVTLRCAAEAFVESPSGVKWRVVPADGEPGAFVADTDGDSLSATPNPSAAFQALVVDSDLDTNGDGFVSLGSEYTVELEWSDATGDRQAAFPPRVPQSLQQLETLINDTLGLPDGLVQFVLEDAPVDPTLRINIGYGICSEGNADPDCAGLPSGPSPSANLNFDLSGAGLGDLVGLEVTGSIDVDYAALGQFDVGVPLDGSAPVLYGTTGLEARLQAEGSDDLSVTASIGPVSALVGAAATGGTGIAGEDSTDGTLHSVGAFPASLVSAGMVITRTSDGEACVVSARTDDDNVVCAVEWAEGDEFELGGRNDLSAGLALELQLTDGGVVVDDNDYVSFADAGIDVTDPAEILDGGSCGPVIEATMTQIAGDPVDPNERDLGGFACAQLSLAADIGGQVYLGELDVELVVDAANPVRAWVPTDLGARLADAALNPAFLLQLLPQLLELIEDGMRDAADAGLPAAVADPLRTGADGIEATRLAIDGFIDDFADALAGLAPGGPLEGAIATELADLLGLDAGDIAVVALCDDGADGQEACDGSDGLIDVRDIRATFTFGEMVTASTGVNLGLEGLPLSVQGGVSAFANWGVTLGVGVSTTDGPYVALDELAPEFLVSAGVTLAAGPTDCADPLDALADDYTADRCLTARLGFLGVEALDSVDNPTIVGAHLGLDIAGDADDKITLGDLVSGAVSASPQVAGGINIDLHIRTGIAGATADLPSIIGTFGLNWEIGDFQQAAVDSTFEDLTSVSIPSPSVSFDNLHLDIGEVLDKFIEPVTKEIKKITGPLQPIVDVITAPIPVVSDLSELVGGPQITMLSVLEQASGADLALIKALAALISFVNGIPDGDGLAPIPLGAIVSGAREAGSFTVDAAKAATSVSPTQAGSLIQQGATFKGGTGFTNDVGEVSSSGKPKMNSRQSPDPSRPSTFGVPGLSFPFLEDASQIFGILVGRDATLIRWDAGTLKASAGISYDFGPIMVGPVPITITLGGEIGIEGRFAIGYDTSGIRKLLAGGSGVALFDGIFIDDLDAQGNDVPEIVFRGRVFAGASVDLVIISAGVRGGIELTFTLDLDDRPDPDGKLRIEEIVDKLANPICLFEVGGKIEAFLEAFVKIDLFFYTEEFSFELVRITLLEWSSACEPPAPKPATQVGGVVYLNIGSRAELRNVQEDVTDEPIEVRQLAPGKIRVTAFGFEEVFTDVTLVVADGGSGDDEILMLPGSDDELVETEPGEPGDPAVGIATHAVPFTIPTVISGGPGNDIVKGGSGPDLILGDANVVGGTWEGVAYAAITAQGGSDGDDTINAGDGDDVVLANGGNDTVEGEAGEDTVEGGEGNDTLNGGPGGDAVLGQGGNDTVSGGPIPQPAPGASDAVIDDDDALSGGLGIDTVSGDFGSDVMFGDDPVGGFMDPDANLRRTGFIRPGLDEWRGWCDAPAGGDGDLMVGNAGNDIMFGGGGDDQMDGNEGDDWACGGEGADLVVGDVGDDELRGNAGDDVLRGDDGDDIVFGGTGDDTANGNDDDDVIFGDEGSDLLFGDDGDDIVVGDTGSVTPGHPHGVSDGANIDEAKVMAMDAAVVRDSTTNGAARASCEVKLGDSDCIFGGGGSDALFGGSDGDLVQGQAGVDLIEGNHGPDNVRGGTDDDLLFGNEDGDEMYGDGGDDAMYGDRDIASWATDTPQGAAVDLMYGGPGTDHMEGDGADDVMFGGADADHMEGNDGADEMYGESGDDDMIGGSDLAGQNDVGESIMRGGPGSDVMAGDNAVITPVAGGFVGGRSVLLLDLPIGGADTMHGDAGVDYMFGQVGHDVMSGGDAGDYMEGNNGNDTMNGDAGDDDMVGGGSATDGSIVDGRNGTGLDDLGETSMNGGTGEDWMAGDNALMDRVLNGRTGKAALDDHPIELFDLAVVDGPVLASTNGPDAMNGDAGTDFMFGQGSDDTMSGGDDPDYMEGNDGVDNMSGGGGDDDMVGGGSADDGIIVPERVGDGLLDQGELNMSGGDGVDWMTGDNALMNRVLFDDTDTPIDLFDVNSPDEALVSGGDTMFGDADDDVIFGQGNGAQGDQSDPPDGLDNDGDGAIDEDGAPWLGDTISGGGGDDYVEGNHGSDLIFGDAGDDDLIGGGSAIDGRYVPGRVGDGLLDERDTIHGGDGADAVTGDNARINRGADVQSLVTGLLLGTDREVLLFDVNSMDASFSGGDFLTGGAERDLMFGQDNGDQLPEQADPLDGVDNDFDGREGDVSSEYDCADNGFDNDGDGDIDAADLGCLAAVDEDQPWDGDVMFGNEGDDYMEGNHGADWMFGGEDEDDMVGGGSAIDGAIVPDRDPAGLLDGPDVMHGDDEDDVMTGDNARINRVAVDGAFSRIASAGVADVPGFGPYDQAVRVTDMFPGDEGPGTAGNDYMTGGSGDDQMYGQLGDDFAVGNAGDDALVGDLGQVRANVLGDGVGVDPAQVAIETNSPHWDDVVNEVGSMLYETELYAFDTTAGGVGGDDVLLGFDGRDTAFGGPGDDVIQGDGDGVEEFFDAVQPEFTHIVDPDPTTADRDQLFGGDGNDAMWGGRDNDVLMGGHGDDHLDVRPREETDNGRNGANFRIIPRDPPSWFTWAFPENFQDVDFIYGGWDRDALQADQAANGPDPGDRLADWAGGFNAFYLCPSGYGDYSVTRMGSPHSRTFLQQLTEASGAYLSADEGTSGFRDLGYVFANERGANSNAPHPDHPGHFTCADYTQVGAAGLSAEAGGPYEVVEGGSVTLDGTGSTGALTYAWEVGGLGIDDASSSIPTISAGGVDDGTFPVSLEVSDGDGSFRTDTVDVTVLNASPVVTLDAPPSITATGDALAISGVVTDVGLLDTHTVSIDWGDGSPIDPGGGGGVVAGAHAYGAPGTYSIVVSAVDDDGGVGEATVSVYIGSAVVSAATWAAADPWPLGDPIVVGGVPYTRATAIAVFGTGDNNNQSPLLFRELVAARLNEAAGADASCVAATLVSADAWLAGYPPGSGVKKNSTTWTAGGQPMFDQLAAYNTGTLCAPAP